MIRILPLAFFCFSGLCVETFFGDIHIKGDSSIYVVAIDVYDIDGNSDGEFELIVTFQTTTENSGDADDIGYSSYAGAMTLGEESAAIKMSDIGIGLEFFFEPDASDNVQIADDNGIQVSQIDCFGMSRYEVDWPIDWIPPGGLTIHELFMQMPGGGSGSGGGQNPPDCDGGGAGSRSCSVGGCRYHPKSCSTSCDSTAYACCYCSLFGAKCPCIKKQN